MDDHIITRWTRGRRGQPDWMGHYAFRPVEGVAPSWTPYCQVDRTLAGWTATAVYMGPYDSVDFQLLRDAKASAEEGLRAHMRGYRHRVASGEDRSLSA